MNEVEEQYRKFFLNHGFIQGRMLSHSKSGYKEKHPENLVIFNACVATKNAGIVWNGDLDLTLDTEKLGELADELHENLYILTELANVWDGHPIYAQDEISTEEIIKRAYAVIHHNEE